MFHPNRAVVLLVLCAVTSVCPIFAEENRPHARLIPEGWQIFLQLVPPGLISRVTTTDTTQELPAEDIRVQLPTVPNLGKGRVINARSFLSELGIDLPEQSIAVWLTEPSAFFALAPAEAVSYMETLLIPTCYSEPAHIRFTGTLTAMTLPRHIKSKGITYRRLRNIAGTSWKEMERIELLTMSACRALARTSSGQTKIDHGRQPEDAETKPLLADGETGTAVEVEPIIGPDGVSIDLSMNWLHRAQTATAPAELELTSTLHIPDSEPIVAGVWPERAAVTPAAKNQVRVLALIITAEQVTSENIPLADAFARHVRDAQEKLKRRQATPNLD
jgi:hypothetical protein